MGTGLGGKARFAPNLPPVGALSDLLFDIAGKNAHIIDLNRKNLMWVEAEQAWVIVDSGKLCLDERFEDSLFTYREAVKMNWGKDLLRVDVASKHLDCYTINATMDQARQGWNGLRNIQYPDGLSKSG